MSEINICFVSDEAVATIKGNIDMFTALAKDNPRSSEAIKNVLPKKSYVEKKYIIKDFTLKTDEDGDYSKVDYDNAITLYEHLKDLPRHVLGDERFWLWVILEKGYAAASQAMPITSGKNVIKDHWLFGQGRRRGLMFGVLSRAFFRVELTKDEKSDDPYALTRFATENYLRYREFTWRSYSNNKKVVLGALKAEKAAYDKYGAKIEGINEYYQEIAKYVSQLGSVMSLDFMSEEYITSQVEGLCVNLAEKNGITC